MVRQHNLSLVSVKLTTCNSVDKLYYYFYRNYCFLLLNNSMSLVCPKKELYYLNFISSDGFENTKHYRMF